MKRAKKKKSAAKPRKKAAKPKRGKKVARKKSARTKKRRGLMFVLSSPSGAGKTTLTRMLL
jgi:ABC-type multidrug transport system ATPase subunit